MLKITTRSKICSEMLATIENIVDIIIKNMGIISAEQRSYTLVLNGRELPPTITIEDAIHKFGLKENDKLALWARVVGGSLHEIEIRI